MTEPCHNAEWTVKTVREHVLALLNERDRQYEQRFSGHERALSVALTAAEKRLDGMNEFRESLADQQRTLMPRSEAELHFGRITNLEKTVGQLSARGSGMSAGWGYAVGLVGVVLAVLAFVMGK